MCVCVHVYSYLETDGLPADWDLKQVTTTPGPVGEVFGGRVRDLSAKTKQKKKIGAFDDARQAKDDLNYDWRAICDRRLSCPTLLSPIILFHFRKL